MLSRYLRTASYRGERKKKMQVFLTKAGEEYSPNEIIKVKFDGSKLRIYFKGKLIDLQPAMSGECFYIQPRGLKKPPIITKAELPTTRGNKIAWALSFISKNKLASSYNNFLEQYFALEDTEGPDNIVHALSENFTYAIAFAKTDKSLLKPVLAYVSDTISETDLKELLSVYKSFRPIFCPEDFFSYL